MTGEEARIIDAERRLRAMEIEDAEILKSLRAVAEDLDQVDPAPPPGTGEAYYCGGTPTVLESPTTLPTVTIVYSKRDGTTGTVGPISLAFAPDTPTGDGAAHLTWLMYGVELPEIWHGSGTVVYYASILVTCESGDFEVFYYLSETADNPWDDLYGKPYLNLSYPTNWPDGPYDVTTTGPFTSGTYSYLQSIEIIHP